MNPTKQIKSVSLTYEEFKLTQQKAKAEGRSDKIIILARSTYRKSLADLFRPYYEEWCKTGEDVVIPYEKIDCIMCNESTTVRKAKDSLLFLLNNADTDEERVRWARMRVRVDMIPLQDGLLIQTRQAKLKGRAASLAYAGETSRAVNWRKELFDWLEIAKQDDIITKAGLTLTPDDQDFLRVIADSHGCTLVMEDAFSFRMMKGL